MRQACACARSRLIQLLQHDAWLLQVVRRWQARRQATWGGGHVQSVLALVLWSWGSGQSPLSRNDLKSPLCSFPPFCSVLHRRWHDVQQPLQPSNLPTFQPSNLPTTTPSQPHASSGLTAPASASPTPPPSQTQTSCTPMRELIFGPPVSQGFRVQISNGE